MSNAFTPLTLPNGQELKNRIAKAAMEEGLGDASLLPDQRLHTLYAAWAKGGAGLLITGNVMIDKMAMTGPGGVALEADSDIEPFRKWAAAAKQQGTKVWMQISHPGRQVYEAMGGKVLSASDIALDMGKHSGLFGKPRAMTEDEIQDVIARFTTTAKRAEEAGFDGVEIHAAHGYLINQFLSPKSNQRRDQWGGSIENRARLLLTVVTEIRAAVRKDFAVAVKLNSADFQRGGFDMDDARQVVSMLNETGVDLVEVSGGNYEAPAMQGMTADARTLAREAYFLEFAKDLVSTANMPLMTTGGITRLPTVDTVLDSGVGVVGIGSALAVDESLPNKWQAANDHQIDMPVITWKDKTMRGLGWMFLMKRHIHRLAKGKTYRRYNPVVTLILNQIESKKLTKRYRKIIAA